MIRIIKCDSLEKDCGYRDRANNCSCISGSCGKNILIVKVEQNTLM